MRKSSISAQKRGTLAEGCPALGQRPPGVSTQRFAYQALLGDGGMGSVEHAFDLQFQRDVAIKRLYPRAEDDRRNTVADVLLREARIAAQVEHPNIPPVYELLHDEQGQVTGLVMMLVHGETLADHLRAHRGSVFDEARLRRLVGVFQAICQTVAFAHERGVLHLDLKAENIMVDPASKPYVVDWGVALRCALDEQGTLRPLEAHPGIRGTLDNMAPEQFERGMPNVDQRTDVYGLGGILYQMLTDVAPFDRLQQARASLHRPLAAPVRSSRCGHSAAARLFAVAMRALSTLQTHRHADVLSLAREVADIAASLA